ncbi:hypothetical protein STRDD10_01776 [Streptococcus sp. DD10]|uniref:hypothetical protein n=1 Tax=Streptococcus sp. DD10 TaxID=1777878 RepID=UPI0007956DD4|nr:hypothetical protein [Streptococcus sp. DD10]KXT72713.1 hypothetical protein STRDD10_01776 [Streptococcus sp. DD10]
MKKVLLTSVAALAVFAAGKVFADNTAEKPAFEGIIEHGVTDLDGKTYDKGIDKNGNYYFVPAGKDKVGATVNDVKDFTGKTGRVQTDVDGTVYEEYINADGTTYFAAKGPSLVNGEGTPTPAEEQAPSATTEEGKDAGTKNNKAPSEDEKTDAKAEADKSKKAEEKTKVAAKTPAKELPKTHAVK